MVPKLYMKDFSPAVRAVLLLEKALDLKLEHVEIDFVEKKEHLTPEFLKINPQHTIPTLIDIDGSVVWDSHAIMIYLVEKYGKNDDLYPKDIKKRAIINQRMFFESGVLFTNSLKIIGPIFQGKIKNVPEDLKMEVHASYDILNKFLEGRKWVAGDEISIADFSMITTISTLNIVVPHGKKYQNISSWFNRAQELPYYNVNRVGLEKVAQHISGLMN